MRIKRYLISLVLVLSSLLGSASPAHATISVSSPTASSTYAGNVTFSVFFAYAASANKFSITYSLTANPQITRVVNLTYSSMMSGGETLNFQFDPLAPSDYIAAQLSPMFNQITITPGDGEFPPNYIRLPEGTYDVTIGYDQNDGQNYPTRWDSVLNGVTFEDLGTRCNAGSMSVSGLVPVSGGCQLAPIGGFIGSPGSSRAIPCSPGTYQPLAGQASCLAAPANGYVQFENATTYTECPAGYTSTAGSDSIDDCIAPKTIAATPNVAKGKKKSLKALALEIGMAVPAKAKVSGKINKASKKFCKISGSKIKGTKTGSCNVTLTVKPKKATKSVKSTVLTVS